MAGVIHSFVTASTITAIIMFIIFMLFGSGGGFSLVYNLGKFASLLPIWIWGVIAGAWILKQVIGR